MASACVQGPGGDPEQLFLLCLLHKVELEAHGLHKTSALTVGVSGGWASSWWGSAQGPRPTQSSRACGRRTSPPVREVKAAWRCLEQGPVGELLAGGPEVSQGCRKGRGPSGRHGLGPGDSGRTADAS